MRRSWRGPVSSHPQHLLGTSARLLWQRAGNAVRLGIDYDDAIRAVTEVPAEAFGLKGYGRLEKGAIGNVVVWSGDPLETSTRVEHVFVRGKEESLETRHSLLLRRYRTLPFTHDGLPRASPRLRYSAVMGSARYDVTSWLN